MVKHAITPVKLAWDKGTPLSMQHKDFYFSLKNGLEETQYVFIQANGLPQRFCEGELSQPFVIAETGFGTGLNFLATWDSWKKIEDPKRPLHFISVEKYPLTKSDIQASINCWPQLAHLSEGLIESYPDLAPGVHELSFEQGQVLLTLILGDANSDLDGYSFEADSWFLDGFSPSKNPSMWTDQLFSVMAKHSKETTTLSTFTAASMVKKGLEKAGFVISKLTGFGAKREMIVGKLK